MSSLVQRLRISEPSCPEPPASSTFKHAPRVRLGRKRSNDGERHHDVAEQQFGNDDFQGRMNDSAMTASVARVATNRGTTKP